VGKDTSESLRLLISFACFVVIFVAASRRFGYLDAAAMVAGVRMLMPYRVIE